MVNLSVLVGLGCAVFTCGHFILQVPKSVGFNDLLEGVGACGSFDATNRESVTSWPMDGSAVYVVTTHEQATWSYKAALLNDTNTWVDVTPTIRQQGTGDFCLPAVRGPRNWVDVDGVLQVIQHAEDGDMYQCAAVRFTSGGPASVDSSCKNGTGVTASFTSDNSSTGPAGNGTSSGGQTESGSSTPSKNAAGKPAGFGGNLWAALITVLMVLQAL